MADEPSKTPGIPAEHPSPQMIPLSKIHDLPGMFIQKQPDKNYGGLVMQHPGQRRERARYPPSA